MDEMELQDLYQWVDGIPLTRPKRNIARDFSDGVLMAELVKHFMPKMVDLHNYSPAQSVAQKVYNWNTLDMKVFKKLGFHITQADIKEVSSCIPGAIEKVLSGFKTKVTQTQQRRMVTGESLRHDDVHIPAAAPPAPHHTADSYPAARPVPQQRRDITSEIIADKDETIHDMKETIDILEIKIRKLEQLVKIKDHKIEALKVRLQQQQQQ